MREAWIRNPHQDEFQVLAARLAEASGSLEQNDRWPSDQLRWCGEAGVFSWFHSSQDGGQGWTEPDLCRAYIGLAAACLATTFVITQRVAACRRIAASQNNAAKQRFLPRLIAGESFATVGISHLTTSRQHLQRPVLQAQQSDGGYVLNGFSPWVTGADRADHLVVGAAIDDGRQLLAMVDTAKPGISVDPPADLMALSASRTSRVNFSETFVRGDDVLAGPMHDVMGAGGGGATGGLQTSALALGLAQGAIRYLETETARRDNLREATDALRQQWDKLSDQIDALAAGQPAGGKAELRQEANSLAIRASEAALVAAKGAGYIQGHPVGRWCREALFFLVWSCPQPVTDANLCEFAQVGESSG